MTGLKLERNALVTAIERRAFLRQSLSIGALSLLAGCDVSDDDTVQRILKVMSGWNDRAQALLFSGQRLAQTYPDSEAVRDFRFNSFFAGAPEESPKLEAADYRLELSGLIADKRPWTIDQIHALPQESQVTRHICVQGWSMVGKWSGPKFSDFLTRIGADLTAKYVGFRCADGYYESLDMPTALHPQTIMAVKLSDEILPQQFGFPFKLRIPTKLGYKNPKWITTIYVTNRASGSFWADRGYNWFGGI